jgi:biotin carboxyl carrier protein
VSTVPLIAALLLAFAAQAAAAWQPPVSGPVAREFDVGANPFEGGRHRGIDLLARPGATVRAPCAGRVVVAGRVGTSGGVVTVLCGRWRVSHLPLATITVRVGASVAAGTAVGTLARRHAGLHLGVRRDGRRFGYVDPLRFLGATPAAPSPPLGRAPRARPPRPAMPTARPARPSARPARPSARPVRAPVVSTANSASGGLAPWPAWAGLALVLAGAGVRWHGSMRTRTRRRLRAVVRLNE